MALNNISRRIPLEGLVNTRDLGGIQTADGKTIRPGRLIRSGSLSRTTEQDIGVLLTALNLRVVVDFRIDEEKEESPDPDWPGVTHYDIPILESSQMGITQETGARMNMVTIFKAYQSGNLDLEKDYLAGVYSTIISSDNCLAGYREFFKLLLAQTEGSVLYHCSAGKDRAGIATALLLTALGVDRDSIIADYMATNEFLKDSNEAMVQSVLQFVKDESIANLIRTMTGVKESYILSVLNYIDDHYPSAETFFADRLALDAAAIAELKAQYLCG